MDGKERHVVCDINIVMNRKLLQMDKGLNMATLNYGEDVHWIIEGSVGPHNPKCFIQCLPEELLLLILSRVPFGELFQARSVCCLWYKIISSSKDFHKMWEEYNKKNCLLVKHCGTISLFDTNERRWFKNMFSEWKGGSSWYLKAADGGLLVLSSWDGGMLRVFNPLTMQFRNLPDEEFLQGRTLSSYIKQHFFEVTVELKVDSAANTYEIIVVSQFVWNKLLILRYRSTTRTWDVRIPYNSMLLDYSHICIGMSNETVYCFSRFGECWASYDFSSEENLLKIAYDSEISLEITAFEKSSCGQIVFYKGRMMMLLVNWLEGSFVILELDDTVRPPSWDVISKILLTELYSDLFWVDYYKGEFLCCGGSNEDEDCIWLIPPGSLPIASINVDDHFYNQHVWPCHDHSANDSRLSATCDSCHNQWHFYDRVFCMSLKFSAYP